jgi:DNA-binding MarR family transcriptional regulator/DNA-binding response OmpR family regulator
MSQTNFAYGFSLHDSTHDYGGLPLTLSIFADRPHVRDQLRDDAQAAGFRVAAVSGVVSLHEGEVRPLGEVVLLDCPAISGAGLAALARLDVRAAHAGAHLIVSTSVDALDDVFGCLDQSNPQILVDPTRAERAVALGRVLARVSRLRLGERGEEDRLMLLRLTEQVAQIAQRLERLVPSPAQREGEAPDGTFRLESPKSTFSGDASQHGEQPLDPSVRLALPDPKLIRRIIRHRQLRARFFDSNLFADPAWDILLDLTAARAEQARVSVTSLCIASGVPPTTALRWISQMVEAGLLERVEDETDRRRAFIALTDASADAMARYFAELGRGSPPVI